MAIDGEAHNLDNHNSFYFRITIRMFPIFFWLGFTTPSTAWEKVSSRFPLTSSFTHIRKNYPFEAHNLAQINHHNTISKPNNPAFQLNHYKTLPILKLHKRAANDDGDDWSNEDHSYRSNNAGYSGVQGSTGLNEMEITLIVVCSAIGLLMFIIGLIFLASHGYHGVMQRDSSESSMGTTRADPKEALSRFEEPEAANPYLLHPSDALLITKQQMNEQSVEKEPLLPCANGAAISDRQQIGTDKFETNKEVEIEKNPANAPLKKSLPINQITHLQNNSRTGLSQSDCSISSFTSTNPSYKYGNQTGYMSGYYGYPCDSSFDENIQGARATSKTQNTMPVVTFRSPETAEEPKSVETQLSDDKYARDEDDDHAANESDFVVDEDIISDDPYRLTGTTRALSLPESFDPDEDAKEEAKAVDTLRPTDSGWGDTVKGHFRGSLPVLHLSVSPEREKVDDVSSYPKPSSSSTMLPTTFDKVPSNTDKTLS